MHAFIIEHLQPLAGRFHDRISRRGGRGGRGVGIVTPDPEAPHAQGDATSAPTAGGPIGSATTCIVCCDVPRSNGCLPCRHECLCVECARLMAQALKMTAVPCPRCRAECSGVYASLDAGRVLDRVPADSLYP